MSQFDEIVKNIALESKKSNYNPEIETNWDCLPMEMRLECVKWMDFRARTRLGATAKTEKSLVESKKYNIDQVRLGLDRFPLIFEINSENSESLEYFEQNATNGFVPAMFKSCEIKNFWTKGIDPTGLNTYYVGKILARFAPFHFKRLSVFRNKSLHSFMDNCVNLEKVDFYNNHFDCFYMFLPELPVLNVKEFRIFDTGVQPVGEFLIGLVQKWIENDVEVGKSVQFVAKTEETLNIFALKFADRIIEKTDEIVRIRMNNGILQVLLRKVGSRLEWSRIEEISVDYYSCKVVPIDMPESEYANGDGWIQAVYEKGLEKDGELENAAEFDAEDQAVWGDEQF